MPVFNTEPDTGIGVDLGENDWTQRDWSLASAKRGPAHTTTESTSTPFPRVHCRVLFWAAHSYTDRSMTVESPEGGGVEPSDRGRPRYLTAAARGQGEQQGSRSNARDGSGPHPTIVDVVRCGGLECTGCAAITMPCGAKERRGRATERSIGQTSSLDAASLSGGLTPQVPQRRLSLSGARRHRAYWSTRHIYSTIAA